MPDFMQKYHDICFKRVNYEARDFRDNQIKKWRDAAYHHINMPTLWRMWT
jgi:hypothetical protein